MLIFSNGILTRPHAIALNLDCCCVSGACCPSTIPIGAGTIVGQIIINLCIDPVTLDVCFCEWQWDGTDWILLSDTCNP